MNQTIVSITDFRRNAGAYINRAVPLTIVKDSKIVGEFVPAKKTKKSIDEDIKIIRRLAGGFNFGKGPTPEEMNEEYDKMYDEMLPR